MTPAPRARLQGLVVASQWRVAFVQNCAKHGPWSHACDDALARLNEMLAELAACLAAEGEPQEDDHEDLASRRTQSGDS